MLSYLILFFKKSLIFFCFYIMFLKGNLIEIKIFLINSFLSICLLLIILINYYFLFIFIYVIERNIIDILNEYFPEEPEIATFWYIVITSKSLLRLKVLIYMILVIFTFIIFIIYRFIWEHESLVLFIFIILVCSSLFYIFCW